MPFIANGKISIMEKYTHNQLWYCGQHKLYIFIPEIPDLIFAITFDVSHICLLTGPNRNMKIKKYKCREIMVYLKL